MLNEVPAEHHIMQSCPTHPLLVMGWSVKLGVAIKVDVPWRAASGVRERAGLKKAATSLGALGRRP